MVGLKAHSMNFLWVELLSLSKTGPEDFIDQGNGYKRKPLLSPEGNEIGLTVYELFSW